MLSQCNIIKKYVEVSIFIILDLEGSLYNHDTKPRSHKGKNGQI